MPTESTLLDGPSLLETALAHHRVGQLGEARVLYGQILQSEPGHPDALHFLGLLACQMGQHDAGLALIEQSIDSHPNGIYYNNFGNMLREKGRLVEAIEAYRRAVALDPGYPEAHNNLGNALREANQPDAAMRSCAQAIALNPDYAEAYNNLANALQDLGDLEAASQSYSRAIELHPDYAEAHNNLGNVLRAQNLPDAAIASYRRAVALKPGLRTAHFNLSVLLNANGQQDEAIRSLRTSLDPDDANAHNNFGILLRDICDFESALTHFDKALALKPDFAEAHCNRGNALRRLNRFEEAVHSSLRALELDPALAEAHNVLGSAYLGLSQHETAVLHLRRATELDPANSDAHHHLAWAYFALGEPGEAMESCRAALLLAPGDARMFLTLGDILRGLGDLVGGSAAYRQALEINPGLEGAHQGLIFSSASAACEPPETLVLDARRYGEYVTGQVRQFQHTTQRNMGPLRIGFVSGDLREHPVAVFLESVLAQLDPARVELFAYATHPDEDAMTARLKPQFARWSQVSGMTDETMAHRIYDDDIHILLDLAGHTSHNRLGVFAWKPAPVQASWLGFFATTGVEAVDYILGDRHVLRLGEESHFVEKLWRLPDSYLCFTPPQTEIAVGPLPMLANGVVTFGCLNNIGKIGDEVVALWSRVLHAVPGSRLLLKASQLDQAILRGDVIMRFARRGIDAARLILAGRSSRDAHLNAFNQIDIALDPFPYPGGTTSVEGLWMGVPVLTRQGDRFLSHVGESIVNTAGLPDWVARDNDDYVEKAVAFSSDPARLASLRAGLRQQLVASPLCDAPRFARNLEDAFEDMWNAFAATAVAT
ncbi:Lipopolysaccharide assembly protein B [Paraburkholderia saeva]|uniref:protein O-GlcNAc transferase n=1 Tax=Paraburkholderia saeva TaxID=2777537 RepID=A0A9N8RYZ1_9BURK|nr:Lipopolysaccharide assembly protein B [Paraburkholderia saeva]CAG4905145.1 Lipopolysaccharide assembly protein B [Paraburkholderia saeva]CAG4909013.1 Lipopolysaccharide assembly protein B [Paraburkholderia saeva]